MKRIIAAFLGAALFSHAYAAPKVNVGAMYEFLPDNKTTLAKRINNNGDSTAFVRVTVEEMKFQNGSYSETPLDGLALTKGQGIGLISSPARLIVPAGGMQSNRLLFIGSREKERYYRVRYIPVIPGENNEFGISKADAEKMNKEISAGVTVLTGYGIIVTVAPEKSTFNTAINQVGKKLTIVNNGNTSIVLDEMKECDEKLSHCSSSVREQLRPGTKLEKVIAPGKVWQYALIEGTQRKIMKTDRL